MIKTTVTEEVKDFLEENCIIVSAQEDDLDKSYYYMPDWMYIDGNDVTLYSFKELPDEMKNVVKEIHRKVNHHTIDDSINQNEEEK